MRVTAVVPAHNEERRIGSVLEVLTGSNILDDIVVVSDGSTDKTSEIAAQYPGVRVIKLPRNVGKGGAMLVGARQADGEVLAFFDADLIGLEISHVDALMQPVLNREADMSIGSFRGGRRCTDWAQKITPFISGQRAMSREEFLSVPELEHTRFGVEVTLSRHARLKGLKMVLVPFHGVTHPMKEEKMGVLKGTAARLRMYWEIVKMLVQTSEKTERIKQLLGIATDD